MAADYSHHYTRSGYYHPQYKHILIPGTHFNDLGMVKCLVTEQRFKPLIAYNSVLIKTDQFSPSSVLEPTASGLPDCWSFIF